MDLLLKEKQNISSFVLLDLALPAADEVGPLDPALVPALLPAHPGQAQGGRGQEEGL